MNQDIQQNRLLRPNQILELIPISKSSWWTGCKFGRYPMPVKLGPSIIVYRETDIIGHCEGKHIFPVCVKLFKHTPDSSLAIIFHAIHARSFQIYSAAAV